MKAPTATGEQPDLFANAPIHVRLVTWDDEPPIGGQGVYIRELRAALRGRGVKVSTLAGRGPAAIPYPRVTGRAHLDMTLSLNTRPKRTVSGEPALLHASGGPGGVHLLRRTDLPLVYTAHHTYHQSHKRGPARMYGAIEAAAYRKATVVAAVSPSTADSLLAMGIPPSKVVVIPPGVQAVRKQLPPHDSSGINLLFVGRLEPEKGALDAVAAMRLIIETRSDVTGWVIGRGSLESKVMATAAATSGRIRVLGHVHERELAQAYQSSTLLLVPSSYEGLCFVALEAMAAGVAVVGYDVPGLNWTVGENGCLVPYGDVHGLASECLSLLQDGERREELTTVARSVVANRHSWDRCAAQFEELYRFVLSC